MIVCTSEQKENIARKITLKEIMKPPYFNPEGDIIGNKNISIEICLDDKIDYPLSEIANWIENAMNEKYEREFIGVSL